MSERRELVDFGASSEFGAHLFRVQIPTQRQAAVCIVEDYGYSALDGGRPGDQKRIVLSRLAWTAIADVAREHFNERLKAAGVRAGRWHTGLTLVDQLLGKELC